MSKRAAYTLNCLEKKRILWISLLTIFISICNLRAFPPLLPVIEHQLKISQMLATSTLKLSWIGLGGGLFIIALLTKKYSKRLLFLGALVIFLFGTFLEYISWNLTVLNIARFTEAFGSAGNFLSYVFLRDIFQDPLDRRAAFSKGFISLGSSLVISPYLTLLSLLTWGWHAFFLLILVMGISLLIYAYFFLIDTALSSETNERSPWRVSFLILRNLRVIYCTLYYTLFSGFFPLFFIVTQMFLMKYFGLSSILTIACFSVAVTGLVLGGFSSSGLKKNYSEPQLTFFATVILWLSSALFLLVMFFISSHIFPRWLSITLIVFFFFISFFACGLASPNILANTLQDFPNRNTVGTMIVRAYWAVFSAAVIWILNLLPQTNPWASVTYYALFSLVIGGLTIFSKKLLTQKRV
jgi:DHA1 family bicyclomycin/chloramphenicol resistance-like MFS transporter